MKLSGSNKSGRHLLKNNGTNPAETSDVNTTEIAAMNPAEIAAVNPAEIAARDSTDVAELSAVDIAAMNSTDIATASANGLEEISDEELAYYSLDSEPGSYENAIDIYYEFVDDDDEAEDEADDDNGEADDNGANAVRSRRRRIIKIAIISAAILLVSVITVLALDLFTDSRRIFKPPDINQEKRPNNTPPVTNTDNPAQPGESPDVTAGIDDPDYIRNEDQITILILGLDDGEYNTDVIMVANIDIKENKIEVVAIPRDTLANVEWSIKKANSILANMRLNYRSETDKDKKEELAMQATVGRFADILGFETDQWVTVNMKGFAALIDAIGGVDFDVPVNMNYHDPYQNLHIEYSKGMHRGLTGKQCLEILRFRSYSSADIGRINTQQQFLTAAVEQILAKRSSINVRSLVDVFINNVRTSIPLDSLIWLGFWFLDLSAEDIVFSMMPGNSMDGVNGESYVSIYLEEWLEMVNTKLNPFSEEVTADAVSILTRGADRKLYVTDGNWMGSSSWGSSSRGPNPSSTGSGSGGSGGGSGSGGSSGGGAGSPSGSGGSGGSGSGSGSGAGESPGSPGDGGDGLEGEPAEGTGADTEPGGSPAEVQPGDTQPGDTQPGEPSEGDRQQPEPSAEPPSGSSEPPESP